MPDKLYDLLPAIIRQRDLIVKDGQEQSPLRALLAVIQEQVDRLHGDIEQLYDDWFIETCQDWVVPYIGDLIGYQTARPAAPADADSCSAHLLAQVMTPRSEVANTIAYRRRKGTLYLLEDLSRDVAGWPARAVEFYRLLVWNQHLNHLRPERGETVDLRNMSSLHRLNGPFQQIAHTVDVREINARPPRTTGRYNIPSVGLFVWRLGSYSVTRTPARAIDREPGNCYTFSVLGNDAPLFARPQQDAPRFTIAGEHELPIAITRRMLAEDFSSYYGPDKSFYIETGRGGDEEGDELKFEPVDADAVLVAALRISSAADRDGWPDLAWPRATDDQTTKRIVADPETGRIMFRPQDEPPQHVRVTYRYGFSAAMGGGEYLRPVLDPWPDRPAIYRVGPEERFNSIGAALRQWRDRPKEQTSAVIEITDSGVYTEPVDVQLSEGESLQLRAAGGSRPVIRLLDTQTDRREALSVSGEGGCFIIDGIVVEGRGIHIAGAVGELKIRHCTLVPGWALDQHCRPRHAGQASLRIRSAATCVAIEHSILGPIHVEHNEVEDPLIRIHMSDSILDATAPDAEAVRRVSRGIAHAALDIRRSTVIGTVEIHTIVLGEDTIFLGEVTVARRQTGCLRFCYVPPGSRTPVRYHCQPDLVLAAEHPLPFAAERVVPRFTSLRYGNPGYCQLLLIPSEIYQGASDEAEMGAFHDLFQPQRTANLRARLDEYTPAAMEAGIVFVT